MSKPVITLTTDFGYQDPFTAIMKGVILKINPEASIFDISSGIRKYDIREAAFTIGMSYRFFPAKTIHVVVVDPGVGSARRPIMVVTDQHYFVGPDNGVFSYIYFREKAGFQVMHVTAKHYFLSSESPTFQGRDIFAPVAAYVSRGVNITKLGDFITDFCRIPLPLPEITDHGIRGEVIRIDGFGNPLTNISSDDVLKLLDGPGKPGVKVLLEGRAVPLRQFYSQGSSQELSALFNSSGFLEFFAYQGDAASLFRITPGSKVEVLPA